MVSCTTFYQVDLYVKEVLLISMEHFEATALYSITQNLS